MISQLANTFEGEYMGGNLKFLQLPFLFPFIFFLRLFRNMLRKPRQKHEFAYNSGGLFDRDCRNDCGKTGFKWFQLRLRISLLAGS